VLFITSSNKARWDNMARVADLESTTCPQPSLKVHHVQ